MTSVKVVKPLDPEQLKLAIMKNPVVVPVDAKTWGFQTYYRGVLNSTDCGIAQNHVVLAVGFGKDQDSGLDFFWVKNSWGHNWGYNGFAKISASKDNICGILNQPSYPSLD